MEKTASVWSNGRLVATVKTGPRKIGCEGIGWIELPQDRFQWRDLLFYRNYFLLNSFDISNDSWNRARNFLNIRLITKPSGTPQLSLLMGLSKLERNNCYYNDNQPSEEGPSQLPISYIANRPHKSDIVDNVQSTVSVGSFLTSWVTISFSRKTLHRGAGWLSGWLDHCFSTFCTLLHAVHIVKQDVLGRTNRLLVLIRHGPHRKRRLQQFFIAAPINDRGIHR
jgi:hypothetical protein